MSFVDNAEASATYHGQAPVFHHRLYVLAFLSNTASIIPRYLLTPSPPKNVDRIANTRQLINYTTFSPLRNRPIALSIETKKTSEGWDDATLQIGLGSPRIMVQGDDRNFALMMQEALQTVLRTKVILSLTSDILAIY
ncbi:hypothetical protein EDB81DRAFT_885115 [Dactylonectria macrodidyma]|uniref:PD-(D/E)XK nuclease-like domain-containing protein n=1 Tax=Dactylonectria macrodidyma TaxID=307937 RepID=A0A9P9J4V0_9HYPO|nr:hypothetical protein EDB81DRAFT_885115 [Dactylonectria macrodidyma]